jgi:hypothetical protein
MRPLTWSMEIAPTQLGCPSRPAQLGWESLLRCYCTVKGILSVDVVPLLVINTGTV